MILLTAIALLFDITGKEVGSGVRRGSINIEISIYLLYLFLCCLYLYKGHCILYPLLLSPLVKHLFYLRYISV